MNSKAFAICISLALVCLNLEILALPTPQAALDQNAKPLETGKSSDSSKGATPGSKPEETTTGTPNILAETITGGSGLGGDKKEKEKEKEKGGLGSSKTAGSGAGAGASAGAVAVAGAGAGMTQQQLLEACAPLLSGGTGGLSPPSTLTPPPSSSTPPPTGITPPKNGGTGGKTPPKGDKPPKQSAGSTLAVTSSAVLVIPLLLSSALNLVA